MNETPQVAAVVVNWNLWPDTAACLSSLLEGTVPVHLIVVDNGSTDESVRELGARFGQAIDWVVLPENRLYTAGANAGLRRAMDLDVEWVLLLNNDTLAAPDLLAELLSVGRADPRIGIVVPFIYPLGEASPQWILGTRWTRWSPLPRSLWAGSFSTEEPIEVDHVTGCAMLVRRRLIQAIGLLDERYVMYYEDADYCERARAAGYRIVIAPRALVWHRGAGSSRYLTAVTCYHHTRSRWRFYRRHRGPWPRALTLAAVLVQEVGRALRDWARGEHALARARWRGLRQAPMGDVEGR